MVGPGDVTLGGGGLLVAGLGFRGGQSFTESLSPLAAAPVLTRSTQLDWRCLFLANSSILVIPPLEPRPPPNFSLMARTSTASVRLSERLTSGWLIDLLGAAG